MSIFIGYILPLILCLLMVGLLFMTDIKAYIIHIMFIVLAFVPVLNWIFCIGASAFLVCGICEGSLTIKSNKLTKFLFNIRDEED